MCVKEDFRPGIHSHGGTGYVTECIGDALRTFTVTYDKCSLFGGWVETNITYRRLTNLECLLFSMSNPVRERSSPSKFTKEKLSPAIAKPPVAPLPLYIIISMGNAKRRVKVWIEKDVGLLECGARCPRFQTAMLQDARERKEYFRQHPNANKHRQHKKVSSKMNKRSAKFNPKTWTYFKKSREIRKNTVTNFPCESENPGYKKKTQNKPAQINTLENMEAAKARITENIIFVAHSVCGRREGEINSAYDTVI